MRRFSPAVVDTSVCLLNIVVGFPISNPMGNAFLTFEIEIIATLLNHGTHPKTGIQILKPETVNGQLQLFSENFFP